MGPGYGNITCTIESTRGKKIQENEKPSRDLPCWWEQKTEEKTNKRGINVKKMKSLVLREEQSNLGLHLGLKAGKNLSVTQNEVKKTKGKGLCF